MTAQEILNAAPVTQVYVRTIDHITWRVDIPQLDLIITTEAPNEETVRSDPSILAAINSNL
jgi:hypothetical protein